MQNSWSLHFSRWQNEPQLGNITLSTTEELPLSDPGLGSGSILTLQPQQTCVYKPLSGSPDLLALTEAAGERNQTQALFCTWGPLQWHSVPPEMEKLRGPGAGPCIDLQSEGDRETLSEIRE